MLLLLLVRAPMVHPVVVVRVAADGSPLARPLARRRCGRLPAPLLLPEAVQGLVRALQQLLQLGVHLGEVGWGRNGCRLGFHVQGGCL